MKFCFTVLFGILFSFWIPAQEVLLSGVITDAYTKAPVPFANVYLPSDPSVGTSADFEGRYHMKFNNPPDTLAVSALGYEDLQVVYEGLEKMDFEMEAVATTLSEVVVKATELEDPAYVLFRKIVKNKPKNNRKNLPAYACEVYNKLELDLVDISEKFKNLKINRPFKFIYDYIDSTTEDKPFLPMFLAETLSNYSYVRSPKEEKELIKASKVAGMKNESVSKLLGIMYQNLNIYNNWLPILSKSFASPISDNGTSYYRYYLVDSNYIDNRWCYQIQFFPKHKNVNAFQGDFWVHDTTFAITRINLHIFGELQLNFIERISIVKSFQFVNDSIWLPKKDFISATTSKITEPIGGGLIKKFQENAPSIQAKRTSSYKKYQFGREKILEKMEDKTEIAPDALKKPDNFWAVNRHHKLSKNETNAYFLIDTIKTLPIIKTWKTVGTLLFTGYYNKNYVEIGNVYTFYSHNQIEGSRVKFGMRTGEGSSKHLRFGAYTAYGFQDKNWKYGLNFLYILKKHPRQLIGGTYLRDLFSSPNIQSDFTSASDGILSSNLLRRKGIPYKLVDIRHIEMHYFKQWKVGISLQLGLANQHDNPKFPFAYHPTPENENKIEAFTFTEFSAEAKFHYKERFIRGDFSRISVGGKGPVISVRYSRAIKDLFKGDLQYNKFELEIRGKLKAGMFGFSRILLRSGKIWGRLPYLRIFIPQGNEGIFRNSRGFNLINEYAFATDRYAMLVIDHHFDGFLFQSMPLFKKWRLRTVANFRALLGDMSVKNRLANELNLFENTSDGDQVRILVPSRKPYMEASFGIENILRFIRIESIWKLNYKTDFAPNWGLRMNLQFSF